MGYTVLSILNKYFKDMSAFRTKGDRQCLVSCRMFLLVCEIYKFLKSKDACGPFINSFSSLGNSALVYQRVLSHLLTNNKTMKRDKGLEGSDSILKFQCTYIS